MHMKYREEADYRQAMDELCFSQVAKARMTRNLRQSLAWQWPRPWCWRWGPGPQGG